ncbi:MAG: hypothetical protein ACK4KT_06340 [Thermaurantimonas sp.]
MKFGISYLLPQALQQLCFQCENLEFLVSKYPEIQHVCAFNSVKELYLTGSAVQAQFKKGDHIDFLVDFTSDDPVKRSTLYMSLKSDLTEILHNNIRLYDLFYTTEDKPSTGHQKRILLYKC